MLGAVVAVQNVFALRSPGRFEMQLAGTQSLLALLLMPLYLDQYQNQVMMLVGINILLGLGLNIVVGYAGCSTWVTWRFSRWARIRMRSCPLTSLNWVQITSRPAS